MKFFPIAIFFASILLLKFSNLTAQEVNGSYAQENLIPEVSIKYIFNSPDRFSFSDSHSHSRYFGQGYYLLKKGYIHLFYDKVCEDNYHSGYDIISSTPSKKLRVNVIVTSKENNNALAPVVRVTKPETSYHVEGTGYNTRTVALDYVSVQDTLKVACPGYYVLGIPLYQYKDQDIVLKVNLRNTNNLYPISGIHEKRKIKINKKGFLLEYNGDLVPFVKE